MQAFKKRGIIIPATEAEISAMELTKSELCFVLPEKGAVDPEDLEGIHRTAGGIVLCPNLSPHLTSFLHILSHFAALLRPLRAPLTIPFFLPLLWIAC